MAVDNHKSNGGNHWLVGANVGLMIGLAIVLVAALQFAGYHWSSRVDLTSTGINSLTPATTSMLRDLDTPVKLVSLYFKTDIEDEDQNRYRSAVNDLIGLYRSTNRGKIKTEEINPLQDHDKRKELFTELTKLPKFKDEAAGHIAAVDNFRENVLPLVNEVISGELQRLGAFTALEGQDDRLIGQVRQMYTQAQEDLEQASIEISDAMSSEVPLYSGATASIRQLGSDIQRMLNNVISVGEQIAANPQGFSPAVAGYFQEASDRYSALLQALQAQQTSIEALGTLSFDDVVRDLRGDTNNALLVMTDKGAKVVPFRTIWPLIDPRMPNGGFKDRKFQGEQKVTSAILQLTEDKKPAVIFVRYGGTPLLTGGFMPGQPQPTYRQMMTNLEDVNFTVHEWDLAESDTAPEIDPEPSRKIFVVMRPMPSTPQMPGQPPQTPPFTPQKLEALKTAMGENPRAIFVAGFMPSMGGMASPYEYNDYLRETWGIDAPGDTVLLFAEEYEPQKFRFQRNPLDIQEVRFGDNVLAEGLSTMRTTFPLVSPLSLIEKAPEGVTTDKLLWAPQRPGLWAVKDVSYYVKQQTNEYIVRNPEDRTGDFMIGATASKGDDKGKIVVIASSEFASDRVALASEMALTSQGVTIRPRNPGNAALFINSLHWLNDNIKWMNLGSPIDTTTLAVDEGSASMKFVWVLCVLILPGLAACGGVFVWMVRRR
ncbi:MAG: Gldg family protein [Phycisphaerales bacterium]|nr:Gldg family protein [Phycisphaerales bacterium]